MARIVLTADLRRYVDCPPAEAEGSAVREALENVFRSQGDHWLEVSHALPPAHAVRFAPAG